MDHFSVLRDEQSAPFFDAARAGQLLIRRCALCGRYYPPNQSLCGDGEQLDWVPAGGEATLVTWAVDHGSVLDPVLAGPDGASSVFGVVELAEGPWLNVPIVGADPASLTKRGGPCDCASSRRATVRRCRPSRWRRGTGRADDVGRAPGDDRSPGRRPRRGRADGPPPHGVEAPDGTAVSDLFWLDGPPVVASAGGDPPAGGFPIEPPPSGFHVRIIRLPAPPAGVPADGHWLRVAGENPEQPGMHATDTLDFMIVLDGEIVLGMEEGERRLGPGDAVVQRGTMHRWRVVGDGPCTYVVAMLRTAPDARRRQCPRTPAGTDCRRAPACRHRSRSGGTIHRPARWSTAHDLRPRRTQRRGAHRPVADGRGGVAPRSGWRPRGPVAARPRRAGAWRSAWSTGLPATIPPTRAGTRPSQSTSTWSCPGISSSASVERRRSWSGPASSSCSAAPSTAGDRSVTKPVRMAAVMLTLA